ncbi:uncharacterized protein [Heliangelus exortis]|uniref:uncharacterized protein n=1 Tax=Heliangelus exortis TaxID=472823 RepID=UPI003A90717B
MAGAPQAPPLNLSRSLGAAGRGGGRAAPRRAVTAGCRRGRLRRGAVQPAVGRGKTTDPPPGAPQPPVPFRVERSGVLSAPRGSFPKPCRQAERRDFRKLPEVRGGSSATPAARRPCTPAPRHPAPREAGVAHSPSPRSPLAGHHGDGGRGGDPRSRQRRGKDRHCLLRGADAAAEVRREKPPGLQDAPSPAAHPGAAAPLRAETRRAVPCGGARGVLRGVLRAAAGAFPGQPRIFRNLPPGAARRGRDRQRGRRNHVGLRDGYNTFYLEKHYITLRDVTWDS